MTNKKIIKYYKLDTLRLFTLETFYKDDW